MKKIFGVSLVVFCLLSGLTASYAAEKGSEEAAAKKAVQSYLKEKSKLSGTLDIYDEEKDAVRNLRTIKFHEKLQPKDGGYVAKLEYRDINSGDIVKVDIPVMNKGGEWAVDSVMIKSIEKADKASSGESKEYSDEEVQSFMKDYVDQQSKFTGSLMLYDEDHNKMCKLKLVSIAPEVRRLGVLRISSSKFEDIEDKSVLDIDITVEIKDNKLSLQRLRIRGIKPAG